MTRKEQIINGLDKDLKQLIDVEMNDPVIGKLLNRNAAYVLGKEIKLVLIERACEWLRQANPKEAFVVYKSIQDDALCLDMKFTDEFVERFRKAMTNESY